jgi:CheY-like chemotaxis protein
MARILVVDDNSELSEIHCKYLEKLGHKVDCVPNGPKALELILRKPPDLVILDLMMPGMDGCGLLEILRSYLRLQNLPVIVLTGLQNGPLVARARSLNANAILLKGKATLDEIGEATKAELQRTKKDYHSDLPRPSTAPKNVV